jgi:protein TonB
VQPVLVQEDSSRRVLSRVSAKYPAVAHNLQLQGSVKVEAVVAPNGKVKSVELKGGHPILVQAAEDAVREWKWEASPRETRELVEIKFVFQ